MTVVADEGIWLRVSKDDQHSDNQLPDLERFTAHHDYEVTETHIVTDSVWNGG